MWEANRWEFNAWIVWLRLFCGHISPIVCLYSFVKQTVSKLQPGKNKAHSSSFLSVCCWVLVLTLCVKFILRLPDETVYCRKASKANTAAGSWYFSMGKENEEEKVWLLADWRHLTVCVSVCVCWGGYVVISCSGSFVYVCPLAWTPVRSFLIISFTSSR